MRENFIINKGIQFTFLLPEQVVHLKPNSNSTYGKSILEDVLLMAKIYLATLITNLMQKISRGRDKRAFYLDVGMDDNIEGVVQEVIKDIKSAEITADTLQDIDTMLNSVGAFEDYFFPTINGEKPIEIDTIQGMDVDIDNEFLTNLKKDIISGTSVPANYIDSEAEVDFASSLAMTNNNFVRNIISFQADFGEWFSYIFRILYKNEFPSELKSNNKVSEKDDKKNIKLNYVDLNSINVEFPSPTVLLAKNYGEQIGNVTTLVDYVTNIMYGETGNDEDKVKFKKKVTEEYYLTTLPWKEFDEIKKSLEIEKTGDSLKKNSSENADDNADDGMDDF